MTTEPASQLSPEVEQFVRGIIEEAAKQRLPELFAGDYPSAVYRVPNRNGVGVIALRTTDLTQEQLVKIMRYRLAQYLSVNFVDTDIAYERRVEYEPLENLSQDDIHIIAGSVETGEMLCYAVLEGGIEAPQGTTLRTRQRPLFPVEQVHGRGIYNRLQILPDIPVTKLREMGRFVKNQQLHTLDELGGRAPVEVGIAIFRMLSGPLRLEVEAVIGDLEEGVAMRNLEFFNVPMVALHGTVPYISDASLLFPRYQYCNVYPFATLAADISKTMLARLDAIEQALAAPGKKGLMALFSLKRNIEKPRSSLEPAGGLAPLSEAEVAQRELPMQQRRQLLDVGQALGATSLFEGLSTAEATILGTFMERMDVREGEVIIKQGDVGEDLFLIESGQAEVRARNASGATIALATLGPGDFFGEVALVTGQKRTADVVAIAPMKVLRLNEDAYARYLAHTAEVEQRITRTAVTRVTDTMRRTMPGQSQ